MPERSPEKYGDEDREAIKKGGSMIEFVGWLTGSEVRTLPKPPRRIARGISLRELQQRHTWEQLENNLKKKHNL